MSGKVGRPGSQPGREFLSFTDPLFAPASHLAHSVEMLGSLPRLRESALDGRVANACLESWLVHVRLLAEFLAPTEKNLGLDITCATFGGEGARGDDQEFLQQWWRLASKQVVHFSHSRLPAEGDLDPEGLTLERMLEANERILALFEQFLASLESQGSALRRFLENTLYKAIRATAER